MNKQKFLLFLVFILCFWGQAQAQSTSSGISGTVQYDYTGDCVGDIDSFFYGTVVRAWQNGNLVASATVNFQGEYFLSLSPGDYLVIPEKFAPAYVFCPNDTLPATVLPDATTEHVDFTQSFDPQPVTLISGYIYRDVDGDCSYDAFEQTFAGWQVGIRIGFNGTVHNFTVTTDANGYYEIPAPAGLTNAATIFINPVDPIGNGLNCTMSCGTATTPTPYSQNGSGLEANVGMRCDTVAPCALMEVAIATNGLRPCQISGYHVHYCNVGGLTAFNASVEVTIDAGLQVTASSIPWSAQNGNVYTFNVGNLTSEQCGDFYIEAKVPCTAPAGITYCVEAHAYPDASCVPANANWDGSQVEVSANCDGDNVIFTIHNVGTGNMQTPLDYIVTEDNILLMSAPGQFQLAAGASTTVTFPANGAFLRLQAEQSAGYPGLGIPVAWAEGCGTAGNVSLGFVNQFPLGDQDPWLDVFCLESANSYDPNDKNGFPRGVKEEHFIEQNVELEYVIRFQNTGTAPALEVEIRDTLASQWLNPRTIRPGASSHAYNWDIQGDGVLVFKFHNINLPDSSVSQALSQGFVQFRVEQRKDVALGTEIHNTAAIYFDNNAPVLTNQTLHTIGQNFLVSSTQTLFVPDVQISIVPNPLTSQALVHVNGLTNTEQLNFTLFSALGKQTLTAPFQGTDLELQAGQLPAGVYFYEIRSHGKLVGNGKLVKM